MANSPEIIEWPLTQERELLADAGFNSFKFFMRHILGITRNPEGKSGSGLKWSPKHDEAADWIDTRVKAWEHTRAHGPQERHYLLIDAARGFMKTLFGQGLIVWLHLRNPEIGLVLSSVVQDFSERIAGVVKEGWWSCADTYSYFGWCYGKWEDPKGEWTKRAFTHRARHVTRKEPSVECISVESGATGRHPEVVILDDPITVEKLKESGKWVQTAKTHVTSLFPVLLNDSLFIIIATPYLDSDVITSQIRDHGVKELHGVPLPPEYADFVRDDGRWFMFHMPALDEHDKPTVPSIWDRAAIDAFQRDDPDFYSSQLLLRPGSGKSQPLTYSMIENMLIDDAPPSLPVSIHLDTALKDPDKVGTGDDNVILVAAHHPTDGTVYYIDCAFSNEWTDDDFDREFVEIIRKWKIKKRVRILGITDDRIIGGKANTAWRRHLESLCKEAGFFMPRYFAINRTGTKKWQRLVDAAFHWSSGRVKLLKNMPGREKLMWQMSRIRVSSHDDLADAAADAFIDDIYKPLMLTDYEAQPASPRRPFDDVLKGSNFGDDAAREAYDREEDSTPLEPW